MVQSLFSQEYLSNLRESLYSFVKKIREFDCAKNDIRFDFRVGSFILNFIVGDRNFNVIAKESIVDNPQEELYKIKIASTYDNTVSIDLDGFRRAVEKNKPVYVSNDALTIINEIVFHQNDIQESFILALKDIKGRIDNYIEESSNDNSVSIVKECN